MQREKQTSVTAQGILTAAAGIFAERGFEGARVDDIARAAGVNKATLYYQIGDKEALYHAVLDRVLGQTVEEIAQALGDIDDCEERIRRFIRIMGRNVGVMRYTAPIMLREVADGGRNIPDALLPYMAQFLNLLNGALAEGQRQGRFRQADSFMVHMLIVGSLMIYSANEPIRQRLAALHDKDHPANHFATPEQAAEQVADLVLAAIANNNNHG